MLYLLGVHNGLLVYRLERKRAPAGQHRHAHSPKLAAPHDAVHSERPEVQAVRLRLRVTKRAALLRPHLCEHLCGVLLVGDAQRGGDVYHRQLEHHRVVLERHDACRIALPLHQDELAVDVAAHHDQVVHFAQVLFHGLIVDHALARDALAVLQHEDVLCTAVHVGQDVAVAALSHGEAVEQRAQLLLWHLGQQPRLLQHAADKLLRGLRHALRLICRRVRS